MPENQQTGEKTEDPTDKRLEEAEKQGQVIRSADLVTTGVTLGVLGTLIFYFHTIIKEITDFMQCCLLFAREKDSSAMDQILSVGMRICIKLILPFAIATIASVILSNVLQIGFILAYESVIPKFTKLNPAEGIKKIFSLKNLFEFIKSSIKVILIFLLILWIINHFIDSLAKLPYVGIDAAIRVSIYMFEYLLILLILLLIIIAVADYFLQRMLTMKELRMTKDEVKREYKETEGDPHVKGARRRMAQELVLGDSEQAVRKSTVLVTNPTHYAVAIYYERMVTDLPILLAKGKGFLALYMMQIAKEADIPIVQNISLAQDIYSQVQVNEKIPDELLEAIADILRWVHSLPARIVEKKDNFNKN